VPDEIKKNDVVQLKSGGPDMTVARLETIEGEVNAVCGWFDGKKDKLKTFPTGMLKRIG
jgi:uncharacterized protein YodC (DUF2158 family)